MNNQIVIDDVILKVKIFDYISERCLREITSLNVTDALRGLRKLFQSINDKNKQVLILSPVITAWQESNREKLHELLPFILKEE